MPQIEAHEVPLYQVLNSDYDFHIPNYQRPYAWEIEQASQLLDDLTLALDDDADEPYFLGSIVLVKRHKRPTAEVIDGQQRLTTLTILLAVLRDLAKDGEVRQQTQAMISEPGSKVLELPPKPRLTLRPRDKSFFANQVQTPGALPTLLATQPQQLKSDAQRAVLANAKALWWTLSQWSDERRLDLLRTISRRTYLVVVSTETIESAHRIFSVMNARGLDLSPADIFKSDVIGNIDDYQQSLYAARWEDAEEAVGRPEFRDLLQHVRVIFSGQRGKYELLREFPQQVLAQFLPGRAAEFVDDVVVPYADAYRAILNTDYDAGPGSAAVNDWLARLNQFEHNDWRPPALWALKHHGNDPVWLDDFFRRLERLAASLLIRRVYATPRILRFVGVTTELPQHSLDAPSLALTPEEKTETLEYLDGDLYLAAKVRKYVLLRLDETLAQDPGIRHQHRIITVEHVLPQNPAADSQWVKQFSDAQRRKWTHRLGNLLLLNRNKNASAQNYDFDKKKTKYFQAGSGVPLFALTVGVLTYDTWTLTVLEKRQDELLNTLRDLWDL